MHECAELKVYLVMRVEEHHVVDNGSRCVKNNGEEHGQ
jgi:hypothetical protein